MEQECGGGTILILILSVFMGIDQHIAQGTNLVYYVPTSISAIITTFKEKLIDFKTGIIVSIFGIFGAIIGANISSKMNIQILKKCFGLFLIVVTVYEIHTLFKDYKEK